MKIKPAEGKVAIEISDDTPDTESDVLVGTIIGVGADVKGMKEGDQVLVHNYVKDDGVKIDDSTYVCGSWAVIGTIE